MSTPTTAFGGVNMCVRWCGPSRRRASPHLYQDRVSQPLRYLPGKQLIPVRQMLAKVKAALRRPARLATLHRGAHRAAGVTSVDDAIARLALSWKRAPTWRSRWGFDPFRRSAGTA